MILRVVELFAGIGAQRMALLLAGIPHKVVAISEINRHAIASYEAIYGDCPNLGDITKIKNLPSCDLVTYSFPCQDLSIAGKRAGMGEGTRSGLVWEVVRLLESASEEERPEWLLMENVPQVLKAPEWQTLVDKLAMMGYCNRWAKLDSSNFGSAQKRIRAFMVSRMGQYPPDIPQSTNAPARCIRDIMQPEVDDCYFRCIPLDKVKWRKQKQGSRIKVAADWQRNGLEMANSLYDPNYASPALVTHGGGDHHIKIACHIETSCTPIAEDKTQGFYSRRMLYDPNKQAPTVRTDHGKAYRTKIIAVADPDKGYLVVRELTPLECWRLMGFPDWAYDRACVVSSTTQLYNQAGNSIVIEVLTALFNSMFRPHGCTIQKKIGDYEL